MNPFDLSPFLGSPSKVKVFAPNGDTKEAVCWLGIRTHAQYPRLTELFIQHEGGEIEVLDKKVVVQNLETGEVIYDPRLVSRTIAGKVFMTGTESYWLQRHPHWPNILELYGNPVGEASEEDNDGLFPPPREAQG